MKSPPLRGLVAATFTPFRKDGSVDFERIPAITRFLARNGVSGIYVCGSTGEGPSLGLEERRDTVSAYLEAAGDTMRTVVHIGHTCLGDVKELAAHAREAGADAISSVAPYYFKPPDVETLAAFLGEAVSGAPDLPFYYYHIPALTGIAIDPVAFLDRAADRIPSLRGIKFTDPDLSTLSRCRDVAGGSYDVLFGRDEMLLSGLVLGVEGAVGSTYNLAPALYRRLVDSYRSGDLEMARSCQRRSVEMIQAVVEVGGEAAIKYPMHRHGLDCGSRRLPMGQLSEEQKNEIDRRLDAMDFEDWAADTEGSGA